MDQGKKIISVEGSHDAKGPADWVDPSSVLEDGLELTPEAEQRSFQIPEASHGVRIDRALADLVPEFSRNYLRQLIESGAVLLNGTLVTKASRPVKWGDTGSVELQATPQSQAFKAEAMDLDLLYEDEYLRVINKPAGLVVHPAPGNWTGTLLNGLLARDLEANQLPRAGIVHRLDKDTSGLMVVARQRSCMDALVKMIAAREMSRQYLAIAHRPWAGALERTVDAPLGRDPRNRLRMAVVDLDRTPGKTAKTDFRSLASGDDACLVHCSLHTGRTHQIRVHLSSIGHPILADLTYGGKTGVNLSRQALHAYRLSFAHPISGEPLVFQAPLPVDMAQALSPLGLSYNGL